MNKMIRILVANHPKLMRDAILAAFADQPDLEIVGEVSDEGEIPDRVNRVSPDLLVVSLDGSGKRPAICDTILNAHPEIRIIAVSSAQNRGISYWATLQIQSQNIEPSEAGLLSAARSMAVAKTGIM
jgi:DNA-binding NarL/FixJ family response regulator